MGKLSDDASEYVDANLNDIRLIYSQYSMSTEKTWRMSADKIAKHVAKFASQYNHPANTEKDVKAIVMAMGFGLRSIDHLSFIASRVKMNQPKPKQATKSTPNKLKDDASEYVDAHLNEIRLIYSQYSMSTEKTWRMSADKIAKHVAQFASQYNHPANTEQEIKAIVIALGFKLRIIEHLSFIASRVKMLNKLKQAAKQAPKEAPKPTPKEAAPRLYPQSGEASKKKELEKLDHEEMLEDADYYMSQFLSSHSIYQHEEESAREIVISIEKKGKDARNYWKVFLITHPDIRNDQQKICYEYACECFEQDTGHSLTLKEFKEIVDRYPHNFVDTWEEEKKLSDERWDKYEMNNRVSRQMYEAKELVDKLAKEYANTKKRALKHQVRITDFGHAIKLSEVNQYPRRFTTSTPTPIVNITSTDKPKLNLSHMHQVDQPESVTPSENTRAPSGRIRLNLSNSEHVGRDNHIDYSIGVIRGVEADDRIYKKEVDP